MLLYKWYDKSVLNFNIIVYFVFVLLALIIFFFRSSLHWYPNKLGIFIVGAKRTAFGTYGGTFKNISATQLQTHACKATLEASGVRPDQVDSVVIGNVISVCSILLCFPDIRVYCDYSP